MTIGKFSETSPASVTTAAGPFDLAVGEDLTILVDGPAVVITPTQAPQYGGILIELYFAASMFANIAAATAAEVAAAINAAAVAQAEPGQPPPVVATVNGSSEVVITAASAQQSNREVGPSIQLLTETDNAGTVVRGAALAALGLTSGIYNASGFPGVGSQPSSPIFHDVLTFTGDTSYPTGGTLGFGAAIKAFYGDGRQVLAVVGQDCGGYFVTYEPATDALKVWKCAGSAAPAVEVTNATNLSAVTFNVLVISA
jgi:hypothetical protein